MSLEDLKAREDIAVVLADSVGRIIFVNARFCELFGWSAEEARGQLLTLIIPSALHDAHHLGFSRFLETGRGSLLDRPLRLRAVDKSGREFDAEHYILAEKRDGQWFFGATIRAAR